MQVLEPIYEANFLGFSYGFRPNRNQHQALDADLKGFFDNIVHACLLGFIGRRICDERVLKLITSWLTAGLMDGYTRSRSEVGTPQGAVISPLLANIYLHYALETWVAQWRLHKARG